MRNILILFALFVPFASAVSEDSSTQLANRSFSDLDFLAGCWKSEPDESGTHIYEHYSHSSQNTIVAFVYTWRGDELVFHEFIRISAEPDGIWFYPYPGGRESEIRFALAASGPDGAEFVNPEHDFPQRISFIRIADGNELATLVTGVRNEKNIKVPYTGKKADCGAMGASGN